MKRRKPLTVLGGDNRTTLRRIPDGTIQTAICSPPYWSVRDYQSKPVTYPAQDFTPAVGLPAIQIPSWKGQLGLEPEPWMFIAHLVQHFTEVARVLRRDGTLWVNIGDTAYSGDGTSGANMKKGPRKITHHTTPNRLPIPGYKPKDLVGIPWMFAKAMQAAGWWLRSEIIWHKPNPAPSSQKDRPTLAHETLFLFTRSEHYFYDNVAIHEPATCEAPGKAPTTWDQGNGSHDSLRGRFEPKGNAMRAARETREKRSVWTIATETYDGEGEHSAIYPRDLVVPCVLAGTSARGACPHCRAPWARQWRIVEKDDPRAPINQPGAVLIEIPSTNGVQPERPKIQAIETTGWKPTCVCGAPPELMLEPNDLEYFETPTGEQLGEDESIQKGGRGRDRLARNAGKRIITRYEHRQYAAQLKDNVFRPEMSAQAADEKGKHAFDHYLRTDDNGARPIPPDLLERWINCGWLKRVEIPEWTPPAPIPCAVLDPFAGTGTTAEVALEHGRDAIVCEIEPRYWADIAERTAVTPGLPLA